MLNYMYIYILFRHVTCLQGFQIKCNIFQTTVCTCIRETMAHTCGMSVWDVSECS